MDLRMECQVDELSSVQKAHYKLVKDTLSFLLKFLPEDKQSENTRQTHDASASTNATARKRTTIKAWTACPRDKNTTTNTNNNVVSANTICPAYSRARSCAYQSPSTTVASTVTACTTTTTTTTTATKTATFAESLSRGDTAVARKSSVSRHHLPTQRANTTTVVGRRPVSGKQPLTLRYKQTAAATLARKYYAAMRRQGKRPTSASSSGGRLILKEVIKLSHFECLSELTFRGGGCGAAGWVCYECGRTVIRPSRHFRGVFACRMCRYVTCCQSTIKRHYDRYHAPDLSSAGRRNTAPPPTPSLKLRVLMRCACGFKCMCGNLLASHMALCGGYTAHRVKLH